MARHVDIARDLAVSPAAITRWRAKGMPSDLVGAREWHAVNVRPRRKRRNGASAPASPAAAPSGDALAVRCWRDRRDRADARLRELELEQAEGKLVERAAIEAALARRDGAIAAQLKAIPHNIAMVLRGRLSAADARFVEGEIARAIGRVVREFFHHGRRSI
jgi:hypothetical protein